MWIFLHFIIWLESSVVVLVWLRGPHRLSTPQPCSPCQKDQILWLQWLLQVSHDHDDTAAAEDDVDANADADADVDDAAGDDGDGDDINIMIVSGFLAMP